MFIGFVIHNYFNESAVLTDLEVLHGLSRSVNAIIKSYPLRISHLWIPYCHRFSGLTDCTRERGCGQPMKRISHGIYRCEHCQITEQRTSQRESLLKLGRETTVIIGGNRSGKTEIGAMLSVAYAAGSKEPWVRDWLKINNLPLDLIPHHSSTCWVSSLSYSDGLNFIRPKLDKYLPMGTKRYFWNSQNQARAILPAGGVIVCKSADSGADKYQGASVGLVW